MDTSEKLNCFPDLTMSEITQLLLNNKFLSDIQFQVNDKVIYAHSLELMKRSAVFRELFILNLGENKVIPVTDVKYESFYQFIRFIYTDLCDIENADMGIDLFKLAIKYKVIRLENKLYDWFTKVPMCLNLYQFCLLENDRKPYNYWIKKQVAATLSKCLVHQSFVNIHIDVVEQILKFDYVDEYVKEIDLFNALFRWMEKYCGNAGILVKDGLQILNNLFHLIRFPCMSIEEFCSSASKIKSAFTESEYGIICQQICLKSQCNLKWSSIPREIFSWDTQTVPAISYANRTAFSVQTDVVLTGITFRKAEYEEEFEEKYLNISTEEGGTQIVRFRCYSQSHHSIIFNSFGDLVHLKPHPRYLMSITGIGPQYNSYYYNEKTNLGAIITDPTNSVKIIQAQHNLIEMMFRAP